jgi:hypothetical protein
VSSRGYIDPQPGSVPLLGDTALLLARDGQVAGKRAVARVRGRGAQDGGVHVVGAKCLWCDRKKGVLLSSWVRWEGIVVEKVPFK